MAVIDFELFTGENVVFPIDTFSRIDNGGLALISLRLTFLLIAS